MSRFLLAMKIHEYENYAFHRRQSSFKSKHMILFPDLISETKSKAMYMLYRRSYAYIVSYEFPILDPINVFMRLVCILQI